MPVSWFPGLALDVPPIPPDPGPAPGPDRIWLWALAALGALLLVVVARTLRRQGRRP